MITTETDLGVPPVPPCRWELECEEPGRNVVDVASLGFKVNACDPHAADHARWVAARAARAAAGEVLLTPEEPEPEPACWCPDKAARWSAQRRRDEVPYCPKHGTDEMRGRNEWDL